MGADLMYAYDNFTKNRFAALLADMKKIAAVCKNVEKLSEMERLQALDIIQTIAEKSVKDSKFE